MEGAEARFSIHEPISPGISARAPESVQWPNQFLFFASLSLYSAENAPNRRSTKIEGENQSGVQNEVGARNTGKLSGKVFGVAVAAPNETYSKGTGERRADTPNGPQPRYSGQSKGREP